MRPQKLALRILHFHQTPQNIDSPFVGNPSMKWAAQSDVIIG